MTGWELLGLVVLVLLIVFVFLKVTDATVRNIAFVVLGIALLALLFEHFGGSGFMSRPVTR